jgi:hypothetical protein
MSFILGLPLLVAYNAPVTNEDAKNLRGRGVMQGGCEAKNMPARWGIARWSKPLQKVTLSPT